METFGANCSTLTHRTLLIKWNFCHHCLGFSLRACVTRNLKTMGSSVTNVANVTLTYSVFVAKLEKSESFSPQF